MTTQTQTQNQNQNQNEQQQQIPDLITREEFGLALHNLMVGYDKKFETLRKENERLQGEVDALKEFAAELRKQKEISDIRAEARNQVLRELGYEVSGSESTNNNSSGSSKSSSCFDYLCDWKNSNRRGLFG